MLAEYFEKRFRREHGGLLDVDGIGVVGESGDGGLVLWKSMSARAYIGSGVRIATSELPLMVDDVEKLDFLPRSQFLRQQAGFKKKALRVRQKG